MNRSSWKVPYIKLKLENQALQESTAQLPKDSLVVYERSLTITPGMIGNIVQVHNGIRFRPFKISENQVGFKLGQFALTKKRVWHKKKKTK